MPQRVLECQQDQAIFLMYVKPLEDYQLSCFDDFYGRFHFYFSDAASSARARWFAGVEYSRRIGSSYAASWAKEVGLEFYVWPNGDEYILLPIWLSHYPISMGETKDCTISY
jgi:hypothetical protein